MISLQELSDKLSIILQEVQNIPARLKIAANQVTVTSGLSDISERLGLVRAGEFRAGNQQEPGQGFSGVRISYPSLLYDGSYWHIAGVLDDVLQFGLDATTGAAYAGGGTVVLDADGIWIEATDAYASTNALKYYDPADDSTIAYMIGYFDDSSPSFNSVDIGVNAAQTRDGGNFIVTVYSNDTPAKTAYISLTATPTGQSVETGGNFAAKLTGGSIAFLVDVTAEDIDAFVPFYFYADFSIYSNATPSADDEIGRMHIRADDGTTDAVLGGSVRFIAEEDWDASGHGARMEIWLVPENSTTEAKAFAFTPDGSIDLKAGATISVDGTQIAPWDGDITDIDIDGGTDIGAALVDADLIIVDDGAGGTNRKSALSRLWTYISGKGNFVDGTYTPTATAVANCTVTAQVCQYARTGNFVTVSGRVAVDPTATATNTEFRLTLPIASNFTAVEQCGGAGSAGGYIETVGIYADTTNDEAYFRCISGTTALHNIFFNFSYLVA